MARSELPVRALLAKHGVVVTDEPAQLQQRLGLRVTEKAGEGIQHQSRAAAVVLLKKPALLPGDEWLGIELARRSNATKLAHS